MLNMHSGAPVERTGDLEVLPVRRREHLCSRRCCDLTADRLRAHRRHGGHRRLSRRHAARLHGRAKRVLPVGADGLLAGRCDDGRGGRGRRPRAGALQLKHVAVRGDVGADRQRRGDVIAPHQRVRSQRPTCEGRKRTVSRSCARLDMFLLCCSYMLQENEAPPAQPMGCCSSQRSKCAPEGGLCLHRCAASRSGTAMPAGSVSSVAAPQPQEIMSSTTASAPSITAR